MPEIVNKFNFVKNKAVETEAISGKSLGYWKDSFRRLLLNKVAFSCLAFLLLLYIFSWIITLTSNTSTIIEPQIENPNTGAYIEKQYLSGLPPRIKGLEWFLKQV